MSFGYSVGDFLGGANLTYQLIHVLKETCGASEEYQDAMLELSHMQQAFLQVSQMCSSAIIPQATLNSASHIVMSAMVIISDFLERSKIYQRKLGSGTAHDVGSSWCKIGWALFKKDELKQLRDSLHSRLSSVSLLLSAASYCNPVPQNLAKFRVLPSKEESVFISSMNRAERAKTDTPRSSFQTSSSKVVSEQVGVPTITSSRAAEHKVDAITTNSNVTVTNDSTRSFPTLVEQPNGDNMEKTYIPSQLDHLETTIDPRTESQLLEEVKSLFLSGLEARRKANLERASAPVRFKDAVGRKFSFPFHLVNTWEGMEELIKQAFLQIDVLGPQVQKGHYDLTGPSGEIILPSTWEMIIKPDCAITMTMWPVEELPPPSSTAPTSGSDANQKGYLSKMKWKFRREGIFRSKAQVPRPSSSRSSTIVDY